MPRRSLKEVFIEKLKTGSTGQVSVNRLDPDSTYLEPNGLIRLQSAKNIEPVSLGPHAIHRQYLSKLEREPGTGWPGCVPGSIQRHMVHFV
jgi:hypothetical protein